MYPFKFIYLLVLLSLHFIVIYAYDGTTCCEVAKKNKAFNHHTNASVLLDPTKQICGQVFENGKPAAPSLIVDYSFCRSDCGGYGRSKFDKPSQWAAPVVQFLLPSLIFALSIPRRKKIEYAYIADWKIGKDNVPRLVLSLLLSMLPVAIDMILWVLIIGIGASHLIVGGLYEAVLDFKLISFAAKSIPSEISTLKSEVLVNVVSGNLIFGDEYGSPKANINNKLTTAGLPTEKVEERKIRLLQLMGSQMSFGGTVGAPVLFYLGAFVYTILDLMNKPSDQDSAISLAFGVEWMVIVHVAIISGCLLASNNPATATSIVGSVTNAPSAVAQRHRPWYGSIVKPIHHVFGWTNAFETEYQPVWMWQRGSNKMKWIKATSIWVSDDPNYEFQKALTLRTWEWLVKILLPATVLIGLPPFAGAYVAYQTPPHGWSCRSLSLTIYATCQSGLVIIAILQNALHHYRLSGEGDTRNNRQRALVFFSIPLFFFSLFSFMGGTLMQIIGVYRNCLCYVNTQYWLNLNASPGVDLASDTEGQRLSSHSWIIMGSVATGFMALTCYVGWWWQRLLRIYFKDTVNGMTEDSDNTETTSSETINLTEVNIAESASGVRSLHNDIQLNNLPSNGTTHRNTSSCCPPGLYPSASGDTSLLNNSGLFTNSATSSTNLIAGAPISPMQTNTAGSSGVATTTAPYYIDRLRRTSTFNIEI